MAIGHKNEDILFESLHIDSGGILVSGKCGEGHGTDFLQTRIVIKDDGALHFSLEERGFSWLDVLKLDPPGVAHTLAEGFIPASLVLESYRLVCQGAIAKLAMLISHKMEAIYNEAAKVLPAPLGFALLTNFTGARFAQLDALVARDKVQKAKVPTEPHSVKYADLPRLAAVTEAFNDWLADNAREDYPAVYLQVESDLVSVYAADKPLWSSEAGYIVPGQETNGREPLTLTRLVATFQASFKVFVDLVHARAPEEK